MKLRFDSLICKAFGFLLELCVPRYKPFLHEIAKKKKSFYFYFLPYGALSVLVQKDHGDILLCFFLSSSKKNLSADFLNYRSLLTAFTNIFYRIPIIRVLSI